MSSSSLTATENDNDERQQQQPKKKNRRNSVVRFSNDVHIRPHVHVSELAADEKRAAWFCGPEYRSMFKNNVKIVDLLGKKEKELQKKTKTTKKSQKKIQKKKEKEKQKQKQKNNSKSKNKKNKKNDHLEDPYVHVLDGINGDDDEEHDDEQHEAPIFGIDRDEEQGYSVRGLENETMKRRRARDETYLRAKFAVLSLQEDVVALLDEMEEDFMRDNNNSNSNRNSFSKKMKKMKSRRNSRSPLHDDEHEDRDDSTSNSNSRDIAATTKFQFAAYAKTQYNAMTRLSAERYREICKHHAQDARERGLQDERTARAIDRMSMSMSMLNNNNIDEGNLVVAAAVRCSVSMQSLSCENNNNNNNDQDKRRPSTASTADESSSSSGAGDFVDNNNSNCENNNNNKNKHHLSHMKRAKRFMRKFVV